MMSFSHAISPFVNLNVLGISNYGYHLEQLMLQVLCHSMIWLMNLDGPFCVFEQEVEQMAFWPFQLCNSVELGAHGTEHTVNPWEVVELLEIQNSIL